jgi:hypothetical protein
MKDDSAILPESAYVYLNMDVPKLCNSGEDLIEEMIKSGACMGREPFMVDAPNLGMTKMIIAAGLIEFSRIEVTMTYNALIMGVKYARTRH